MSAPLAIGSVTARSPVVDEAHAPAAVRDGSTAVKQAYSSAQGFEEMLMQQLSQSLLASSGLGGEGSSEGEEGTGEEGGSSASSGALSSLLPQALTEGVTRQGGLGLASQLMRSLDPAAASGLAQSPASSAARVGSASGADAGSVGRAGTSATGGVAPDGGLATPAPASAATPVRAPGIVGSTGGVAS
jgi:Rod binding domain-containing protein